MVGVRQAEQPADDSLVEAAQSGSARAFDLLVVRHHAPILRYLARQTGDPELAADLAQETFLDAFRSLDQLVADYGCAVRRHRSARHNLPAAPAWRRLRPGARRVHSSRRSCSAGGAGLRGRRPR
jgi:RNA polymerase sigma-70 factor (ECF subfamily)